MGWILSGIFICMGWSAARAGAGLTYHGRLIKPDGRPVTASAVQFRLQIRTPGSENCLLYQETHTLDLSSSDGVFALTLNDGNATVVNTEPFTIDRAFQNRGTFTFAGGKCAVGTTYAPNPADGRKIAVEFDDGSGGGFEVLPSQTINFVPMAMESMTVGGYGSGSMLRVNDVSGAPASISALTQTQYTTLMDLIAGTSSNFLNSSSSINGANLSAGSVADAALASGISGSKISGNISGHSAGFTGSLAGDVTGAQGTTSVVKLRGRDIDTAVPANGQVLAWNQTNSRWEPTTPSTGSGTVTAVTASAPLASSGGTAPNLTITQASTSTNGYLSSTDWNTFNGKGSVSGVGFTAPSIFSVSGAPVTTTGTIAMSLASQSANQVFAGPTSGTAAPTFRSLNISDIRSTNTGTFLTGSTCSAGQALVYSSVSDTISCSTISLTSSQVTTALGAASTSTNGYLTSTDWNTFNGKQNALSAASTSVSGYLTSTDWNTFNNKQAALGFTPVNKAGDTMSGTLNLPSNGLAVGTNQLVVSSGSVGIGTASPSVPLEVNGYVKGGRFLSMEDVPNSSGYNFAMNRSDNTKQAYVGFTKANTQQFTIGQASGSDNLTFNSSASGSFLFSGGSVGIGTATPSTALHVNGTVTATAYAGSGASLTSLNASNLSAGTVPTARLGTGTASSSTYLRGDGTWSSVSGSGLTSCRVCTFVYSSDGYTPTGASGWVCSAYSSGNTFQQDSGAHPNSGYIYASYVYTAIQCQ